MLKIFLLVSLVTFAHSAMQKCRNIERVTVAQSYATIETNAVDIPVTVSEEEFARVIWKSEVSVWNRKPGDALVLKDGTIHKRAHPECIYMCNDPVFSASCKPRCQPTVCEAQCECGGPPTLNCDPPQCTVRCPPDQSETDQCPQCETICKPLHCFPYQFPCSILCQETVCDWLCSKPRVKPPLICQVQCELPACAAMRSIKDSVPPKRKWVQPLIAASE